MAALCGVVKVILSFFRHGEEGAVERHRSCLTVNFDEQGNISIFKKHLCDFVGIKEQAAKYGFGTYELKLFRLAKSGGKTKNYEIITQGQWELEFPNLAYCRRRKQRTQRYDLLYYFSMFYKKRSGFSYSNRTATCICYSNGSLNNSLNFYVITDSCQSKILYIPLEEVSDARSF